MAREAGRLMDSPAAQSRLNILGPSVCLGTKECSQNERDFPTFSQWNEFRLPRSAVPMRTASPNNETKASILRSWGVSAGPFIKLYDQGLHCACVHHCMVSWPTVWSPWFSLKTLHEHAGSLPTSIRYLFKNKFVLHIINTLDFLFLSQISFFLYFFVCLCVCVQIYIYLEVRNREAFR